MKRFSVNMEQLATHRARKVVGNEIRPTSPDRDLRERLTEFTGALVGQHPFLEKLRDVAD
jgi:hypothetical protein